MKCVVLLIVDAFWLILIRKCVVLLIVNAFWLTLIRKWVVNANLINFSLGKCIRLANSGPIRKFIRISLHKAIFACFLVSLTQFIIKYDPTVDFIVHAPHGHTSTQYGRDYTAASISTTLLPHFWLFFQYSLDLITQIIVNCLPPVVNISNASHGHPIADPRVDTAAITRVTMIFRVFGLFSVFPYESCLIPRQRASTRRLYHLEGQSTPLWKVLYRLHRY